MDWREFVKENRDIETKRLLARARRLGPYSPMPEISEEEQQNIDNINGMKIGVGEWAYLYVKVGEKWITHANIVWEEAYGKLLEDWSVHHEDKDKLNDELPNLVALPKKLHFTIRKLRSTIHLKGTDSEWSRSVISDFLKFSKIRKDILDQQEMIDLLLQEKDSDVSQLNEELLSLRKELTERYEIIVDFLGPTSKIYFREVKALFVKL